MDDFKVVVVILLVSCFAMESSTNINIKSSNVTVLEGDEPNFICQYTPVSMYTNGTEVHPLVTWSASEKDNSNLTKLAEMKGNNKTILEFNIGLKFINSTLSFKSSYVNVTHNKKYRIISCTVDYIAQSNTTSFYYTVIKYPKTKPEIKMRSSYFFLSNSSKPQNIGSCISGYGFPAPNLYFQKNGQQVKTNANVIYDADIDSVSKSATLDLVIAVEKEDHQADYECIVETKFDQFFKRCNKTFKFNVMFSPEIDFKVDKSVVSTGSNATFTCTAHGYPNPDTYIDGFKGNSYVKKVNMSDNNYEICCVSNNSVSSKTKCLKLDVLSENNSSQKRNVDLPHKQVKLGQLVNITCSAKSNLTGKVLWYKDGELFANTMNLVLQKVKWSDNGNYTCEAKNKYANKSETKTTKISVLGLTLNSVTTEKIQGKNGDIITLMCKVKSNPKASFAWKDYKGDEIKVAHISSKDFEYFSFIKVHLSVDLSKKNYTCIASNANFSSLVKSFILPTITESTNRTAAIVFAVLVPILLLTLAIVLYKKGLLCKGNHAKSYTPEETKMIKQENEDNKKIIEMEETNPSSNKV